MSHRTRQSPTTLRRVQQTDRSVSNAQHPRQTTSDD